MKDDWQIRTGKQFFSGKLSQVESWEQSCKQKLGSNSTKHRHFVHLPRRIAFKVSIECLNMMKSLLIALFLTATTAIDPADFELRSANLRANALSTPTYNLMGIAPIQAFVGDAIPQSTIDDLLFDIDTDPKADFRLVQLIRILLFDDTYTTQILNAIKTFPYWLTVGDTIRVYWSENHHIMWMSSAFLLNQEFGIQVDDPVRLRTRLVRYLETKIDYGYYEFFSTLYLPYNLSGLLNLVDFSQDTEIQNLAQQAAERLVTDLLKGVTTEGVLFPAAGRNLPGSYLEPYNTNYNSIVWLMTGLGVEPTTIGHVGAFLTTTQFLDVTKIVPPQDPFYEILDIGHSPALTDVIYASLNRDDQTLAQFSFGGYFHPYIVKDTIDLFDEYGLWNHEEFDAVSFGEEIPSGLFEVGVNVLEDISRSSLLVQEYVAMFRNGPVALSSVQNYFKGKLGYQQFPWMATVGTLGVWTQAGVGQLEGAFSGLTTNTHLPYIQQKENVALIMYNPDLTYRPILQSIGIDDFDVKLCWPEADFDETLRIREWYLGSKDDAYIAVRSHCGQVVCTDKMQTWAVVVGSAAMYSDFTAFQGMIENAYYEERRRFDWPTFQKMYFGWVTANNPDSGDITVKYNWPLSL